MAVWRAPVAWGNGWRNRAAVPLAGGGIVAALALVILPTKLVLGAVAGVALVGAIAVAPILGLYVLPVCVAFGSLVAITLKGLNAGPTDLVVATMAASIAARRFFGTRAKGQAHGGFMSRMRAAWATERQTILLLGCLLAYVAAIALSGLVAIDRASVAKELIKWLEVTVVVVAARWLLRTPSEVRGILWAAIAVGALEALLGFAQWIYPMTGPGAPADGLRSFGTFAQPNPYAGYLNLSLPIAIAVAALARDARERWLAGGASLLMLGALALADSRGGLLGIAGAIVVIVVVGLRKERPAALALAIGLPAIALAWVTRLVPSAVQVKVLHTLRLDNISVHGQVTAANFSTMERLAHWVAGLRMFRAHPILGVGAGNYDAAYPQFTVDPTVWHDGLGHAHNYYINAAAETGFVGLVAFLAVVAVTLVIAWAAVSRTRQGIDAEHGDTRLYAYAVGILAVLIGFAVHNATDNLYVHAIELQFGLEVACALVIARLAMCRRTEQQPI
jgi:O-antigen ligase